MEALFLKLVNMSISASWLVLAVVVLRFALKKAPKWITCALWAMVAIRLVFPFSVESMFSLIPEPVSSGQLVENATDDYWGTTHIYHDNREEYQTAVDAGRKPIHAGEGHYYVVTAEDGISEPPTVANTVIPVLSDIWIVGVILLVIYAAVSYLLIQRKVSASLHLRDNLYLCDYIESPFILGILRPRIYLPSSLDQTQWPHVLAHEQAHLHRRDHWWKPIGFILLCVYWFNPVLWLAYILLCRDIELACDERVIRDMDIRQKQDYTTALLECSMPRYLIAACPLAFGEVGVKERVKTVLNYKKPAFWIILIALVLCAAAAVCFLTDPMGNNVITPGVYDFDTTLYLEPYADGRGQRTVPNGQYILHNNTLYVDDGNSITALGRMTPYDLDNRELDRYLRVDDWWQVQFYRIPTVSEALWLRMEDGDFYVWFQTNSGETFLARGVEDYGERYDWFDDDTLISHLCRLTYQESAVTDDLSWFSGTVVDSQATYIVVRPDPGTEESHIRDQFYVSLYEHYTDGNLSGLGVKPVMSIGTRVRIVYDGTIGGSGVYWIHNPESIEQLPESENQYTVISGNNKTVPLRVPVNTDLSTLSGLPMLTMEPNDSKQYQFQLLRNGQPNPGHFRLYDYKTKEEIRNFDYLGNTSGPDWSLLEPGRNYIVVQERDGLLCFIALVPYDFGITLTASDISPTGMTVTCTQSGGNCPGEITYSPNTFVLRRITDYGWENVPHLSSYAAFSSRKIETLQRDSTVTWNLDWSEMYGTLEPGEYRFDRYFSHGDALDDLTYIHYSVYFTISDGSVQSRFPDYFRLNAHLGLELYALEDGYVLMSGSKEMKTDAEINALPRATAEEMKEILEYYHGSRLVEMNDIIVYSHTDRTERDIRKELGILPTADAALYITSATATEGLVKWYLTVHPGCEVWTGYDYSLEVLTDNGWVHYGYPTEELAWPSALRFHYENTGTEPITATEIFDIQWSTTTGGPLPPGQYRYQTGVTVCCNGEYSSVSCDGYFDIPEDTPENPGIHMEVLNPTETGATLAITYKGGLMGELTTQGQYYLMVDVGNGASTTYGKGSSLVPWDDVLYPLPVGETVYIDVRWDHTAEAPLPPGIYYVVLSVNQTVPYQETEYYQTTKHVTGTFALVD